MRKRLILIGSILLVITIILVIYYKNVVYYKEYGIEELTNEKFEDVAYVKMYKIKDIDLEEFINEYKDVKFKKTNKYKSKKDVQEAYVYIFYECYDKEGKALFTIGYIDYPGSRIYKIFAGEETFDYNVEYTYYEKVN